MNGKIQFEEASFQWRNFNEEYKLRKFFEMFSNILRFFYFFTRKLFSSQISFEADLHLVVVLFIGL